MHVGNDLSVVDRALRMLKEKVDGIPALETIRKVRTKLRLSQRRVGALSDRMRSTSMSDA